MSPMYCNLWYCIPLKNDATTPTAESFEFLHKITKITKSRGLNDDWWFLSFIQLLAELLRSFRSFVNLSGVPLLINVRHAVEVGRRVTAPVCRKNSEFSTMASLAVF
jgi:hypothetical protein